MSQNREQLYDTFSKVKEFIEAKIDQYKLADVPEDMATKYAVEEMTQLFEDASDNNGARMEKIQQNYDVLLEQMKKEKTWKRRPQDYLPKDVRKPETLSPYEWSEYTKDRLLKGDIWSFIQYWLAQKDIEFPDAPRPELDPAQVREALDQRNPEALKIIWRALGQLGLGVLATSALAAMVVLYRKAKKERQEALERNMEKDPKAFIIRVVNPSKSQSLERKVWKIIGTILGDDLRYRSEDTGETSKVMLLYSKPVTRHILEQMQTAIVNDLAKYQYASKSSASPRHIKRLGQVPLLEIHVLHPKAVEDVTRRSANRSTPFIKPRVELTPDIKKRTPSLSKRSSAKKSASKKSSRKNSLI